ADVAVLWGQCVAPDPAARASSADVARRLAAAVGTKVAVVDQDGGADAIRAAEQHARTGTRVMPPLPPGGGPDETDAPRGWIGLRVAVVATVVIGVLIAIGGGAVYRRRAPAPRAAGRRRHAGPMP